MSARRTAAEERAWCESFFAKDAVDPEPALAFAEKNGYLGARERIAELTRLLGRHGGHVGGCKAAYDGRECVCGFFLAVTRYDLRTH